MLGAGGTTEWLGVALIFAIPLGIAIAGFIALLSALRREREKSHYPGRE